MKSTFCVDFVKENKKKKKKKKKKNKLGSF